jgi:hypothetical protein
MRRKQQILNFHVNVRENFRFSVNFCKGIFTKKKFCENKDKFSRKQQNFFAKTKINFCENAKAKIFVSPLL